jgi:hypothetical protein
MCCYIVAFLFVGYIEVVYKPDFCSAHIFLLFIINVNLLEVCYIFRRALFQMQLCSQSKHHLLAK